MKALVFLISMLTGIFLSCAKPSEDSSALTHQATLLTATSAPLAGTIETTGTLPANLAEDIKLNAINAAFPGRYAYPTPTNLTDILPPLKGKGF